MSHDDHTTKRYLSLFMSVFVGLASGTPYLYGIYSVQLVQKVGLTASDAAIISLATNMGSGIGGLFGGVFIDVYGPRLSILVGSFCIFSGYLSLYLIYSYSVGVLVLICISGAVMGFGSVMCFFSALKAAQSNFPKHRGTAGIFPVSCYGLAATLFSVISANFFEDDTGGLLRFLAFCCGLTTFIGSGFVGIFVKHEDEDLEDHEEETSNLLHVSNEMNEDYSTISEQQGSSSATPIKVPQQDSDKDSQSFVGSLSFWGLGKRTPKGSEVSSTISDYTPLGKSDSEQSKTRAQIVSKTDSYQANIGRKESIGSIKQNSPFNNDTPEIDLNSKHNAITTQPQIKFKTPMKKHKSPWQIIGELVKTKDFVILYLLMALFSGACQTYIYSVGFIVAAQVNYDGPVSSGPISSGSSATASQVQALQVGIISVGSFSGRVIAGLSSDFIYKTLNIQRLWIVLVTTSLLASAHYITMTNSGNVGLISISSAMIGGSYGLFCGTYPAVIADRFGTRTFSTIWGLICTGPLPVLYILEKYFGVLYDANTDPNTGICYRGSGCYRPAFQVCLMLCVGMVLINLLLLYLHHKKHK